MRVLDGNCSGLESVQEFKLGISDWKGGLCSQFTRPRVSLGVLAGAKAYLQSKDLMGTFGGRMSRTGLCG